MQATSQPTRSLWILSHRRVGDLNQMLTLARALGWPATVKRLRFRAPELAAVPFLARWLFDAAGSDPLGPPWPDLVVCAEGRASTIAQLIKRRSAGSVKIVCLGRPAGSPAGFDLVLTTPQYRLPRRDNTVELALPLTPEPAPPAGDSTIGEGQRPLIAVLVGGTSLPDRLDAAAAEALARDVLDHAGNRDARAVLVTSPRTSPAVQSVLAQAVPAPHAVHLWQGEGDDALARFLAQADQVVVTSDSVSMVADALAAGKAVSIYRLPQHHSVRNRLVAWLHDKALAAWLFDHGIVEVRSDRRRLFDKLAAQGRVHWFGEPPASPPDGSAVDSPTEVAVTSIKRLFAPADHTPASPPPR